MAIRHALCLSLIAAFPALAAPAAQAPQSPQGLSLEWNARLRYEGVDDDAFARSADAMTLRVRSGLHWRHASGLEALVEGEGVAGLTDDFDSTANRRGGYPVVADPTGVELNQAWLRWQDGDVAGTLGRQRITLDNQRWIGNSGWRQNEQTFDAVLAQWSPMKDVTLRYAWLDRVHRVNGDHAVDPRARERDLSTHLVNLGWAHGAHLASAYVYLHDDQDVAAASTRTRGARYMLLPGKGAGRFGIAVEAARQDDYADNPLSFSHDYLLVEPNVLVGPVTLRAGLERLGGDGRHALQTPLATLHAFNGWADRFTATPAAGLEDRYVGAGGSVPGWQPKGPLEWVVTWHDYSSDAASLDYGRELDASLAMNFSPAWRGMVKWAGYRADGFGADGNKVWLQLEWSGAHPLR